MSAKYTDNRPVAVALAAICVLFIPTSTAYAQGWDDTPHDWDQIVESDGGSGIKVSADAKWGQNFVAAQSPASSQTNAMDDAVQLRDRKSVE